MKQRNEKVGNNSYLINRVSDWFLWNTKWKISSRIEHESGWIVKDKIKEFMVQTFETVFLGYRCIVALRSIKKLSFLTKEESLVRSMKRSREWKIIGRNDKKDNSLPIFLFFFFRKRRTKNLLIIEILSQLLHFCSKKKRKKSYTH